MSERERGREIEKEREIERERESLVVIDRASGTCFAYRWKDAGKKYPGEMAEKRKGTEPEKNYLIMFLNMLSI